MQNDTAFVDLKGSELNRNERYRSIEKPENIEESGSDLFGDYDSPMIKLGASLAFNVPVFDRSDNVTLIESTKHNFNLVEGLRLRLMHKKVDPARMRLTKLATHDLKFT